MTWIEKKILCHTWIVVARGITYIPLYIYFYNASDGFLKSLHSDSNFNEFLRWEWFRPPVALIPLWELITFRRLSITSLETFGYFFKFQSIIYQFVASGLFVQYKLLKFRSSDQFTLISLFFHYADTAPPSGSSSRATTEQLLFHCWWILQFQSYLRENITSTLWSIIAIEFIQIIQLHFESQFHYSHVYQSIACSLLKVCVPTFFR